MKKPDYLANYLDHGLDLYDRLAYLADDVVDAANLLDDVRQDDDRNIADYKMRLLILALSAIADSLNAESEHLLKKAQKTQDTTT